MSAWDTIAGIGTGGAYTAAKGLYGASGAGSDAPQVAAPDQSLYQYGGDPKWAGKQMDFQDRDSQAIDSRRGYTADNTQYNADQANAGQVRGQQQQFAQGLGQFAQNGGQGGADQQQAAGYYQGVLNGSQPSLAQQQMTQGVQMGAQNAENLAANATPGQGGLAVRGAQMANQASALGAAGQGAMLRAQEVGNAAQGLGGLGTNMRGQQLDALNAQGQQLGQMRGQDQTGQGIDQAQTAQGMNNYYTNRGINDARHQNDIQNEYAVANGLAQNNQAYGNALMGTATQNSNLQQQKTQGDQKFWGGLVNNAGGAATKLGGM